MSKENKLFRPNWPFEPSRLPVHYAWVAAGVGSMGMIASLPGQTVGVNVFSEKLISALDLSRTGVSAAYFLGTAISGFALPVAGTLFDRWGARRMITLATLGLAAALGYMSVVDLVANWGETFAQGAGARRAIRFAALAGGFFLIRFLGQGLVMMTSRNMIGKWWVAHRGKVFSISGIAVTVSFSLAPKVFDSLIESWGWREAWRGMALVIAPAFCLIAWLFYRDNPAECGLETDAGMPAPERKGDDREFRIVREFTRPEALRCFSFWVFCLVFATQSCYFTGYAFHVVDVAADLGRDKAALLNLFVPSAALSAVLSVSMGWLSDRWRLKYLLVLMAGGNALASLGLATLQGSALTGSIVIGFGIGSGCFGALSGVFMPRFFGLKHLGAISGFFASAIVLGSSLGPLGFSLAKLGWGTYASAHWLVGGVSLALLVAAFWADNPQRKLAR